MKGLNLFGLCVVVFSFLVVGCNSSHEDKSKSAQDKQYDVRGTVKAMNAAKPAVTLDHEDIPGLMKAMEMEFSVENPKLLDGIKVGDQVRGRLKKGESGYVITHLEKQAGR